MQLTRIHLEEDVGKLTHYESDSLVDYNRAGSPLLEIVSEPDLFSPDEVFAYLTSLRNSLVSAGISSCDMEKGQLRCDANISIRPVGTKTLGTKVELKNLNTISGVRNEVEYDSQADKLLNEGEIFQKPVDGTPAKIHHLHAFQGNGSRLSLLSRPRSDAR